MVVVVVVVGALSPLSREIRWRRPPTYGEQTPGPRYGHSVASRGYTRCFVLRHDAIDSLSPDASTLVFVSFASIDCISSDLRICWLNTSNDYNSPLCGVFYSKSAVRCEHEHEHEGATCSCSAGAAPAGSRRRTSSFGSTPLPYTRRIWQLLVVVKRRYSYHETMRCH